MKNTLEDKYYTLDDLAKIFSMNRVYLWRLVSLCTVCGHSYGKCTCPEKGLVFSPAMKSIDIGPISSTGRGERRNARVPHSEVIKRIKKYNPNI
jgi:hypothetical protein